MRYLTLFPVSLKTLLGMDILSLIFLFPIIQHLRNKLILIKLVAS